MYIHKLSYSGASKIFLWLANQLANAGNQVDLIACEGDVDTCDLSERISLTYLKLPSSNRVYRGMSIICQLRKCLGQRQYQVAISFLPVESMYLIMAAYGKNIPVIVAERSDPYLERSLIAKLARFTYRFADGAVFQTLEASRYFPAKLQRRSCVIPNPVLQTAFPALAYNERKRFIVTTGRMEIHQKRQDVLLQAFAIVAQSEAQIRLALYGDGPDLDKLKQMAQELGIAHRVEFCGRVSHVVENIKQAQMFVFSSDFEGIPNSIIEALNAGLPVVTTDCSPGGAKLLVMDGNNGYVVPRGDASALAEKILCLLHHPEEMDRMARNALEIRSRFTQKSVFHQWQGYINSIALH